MDHKSMKSKTILFLFSFFQLLNSTFPVFGQDQIRKQLWYGYAFSTDFSPSWFNETELMERHTVNPFEQSQFLIRTRFHKKINPKINVGLGGSLFLFHRQNSKTLPSFSQPELRPHGEFNLRTSIGPLNFENRWRGELRYFQNTNLLGTELQEGYHFAAVRFRYRLQAIIPVAILAETKALKLKLADEVMAMAGGKINQITFDQNRISIDFSMDISSKISLDLGYVNWYQANSSGGFLKQHIVRTVLKHQLTLSKQ